ncbi:hypothetical protein ACFVVM_13250 [Nocardia sp. NPDC058176]|uniref:hypothetical protein n=1 Tax=Nocardia sp. NPDC058176 TaxID=3346368 RepID=UPI0036DCD964
MIIRNSLRAAAVTLLGVAALTPMLAQAEPAITPTGGTEGCVPFYSSEGPRPCARVPVTIGPTATMGEGICAGPLTASGAAYDGPVSTNAYHRGTPIGAEHFVTLQLISGWWLTPSNPIGACNLHATLHWRNLDTGAAGAETRYLEPFLCINTFCTPEELDRKAPSVYLPTGPGRVHIDLTTDHPGIPMGVDVVVP